MKRAFASLAICAVAALPSILFGQEPKPKLLIRVDPATTPKAMNIAYLRPNTATTMALYLQNLGQDVPKTAVIKLVQVVGGQQRVIGLATLNPAGNDAPLVFAKPKEASPKDAPKDATKDADKIDLAGPPYQLLLLVEGADGKKFLERFFDVRIRSAHDLVSASCTFDKSTRQLRFKVTPKEALDAKGCPVELVLGPGFAETKKGTFKQVLTNQTVELFADGVEFLPGANPADGRVYLNVNGYDRAFTFQATLKESGDLSEIPFDNEVGARIRAPESSQPSEKFKIGLEMDGSLDAGQLEVGLSRSGKKDRDQFQVLTLPSLRKQKVQLSIAPTGELVWQTEVRDWQIEFDTADVFGRVWFRVRVLNGAREVDVVRAPGKRPGETALEADPDFPRSLFAPVILDGTPPENVKFVNLPKWVRGKETTVQAMADKRPIDRLSPIEKVLFFQGKMPADGKLPPDAVPGQFDAASGLWKADIVVPDKESFDLSVQFVTGTGMQAVKSINVHPRVAGGAAKWATVKGTVVYGDRLQLDLTVTLSDDKGKVKGTTKTNDKGEYSFEKVLPGSYFVTASRNFPALFAQVVFDVAEGQDLVDNVAIRLKSK